MSIAIMQPHAATYEALTGQPSEADTSPRPSRSEKVGRRESRIGLRNIFGRSKQPKTSDASTPQRISRVPGPGVRASIAGPPPALPTSHFAATSPGKYMAVNPNARPISTLVEDVEPSHILPVRVPETVKPKPPKASNKLNRGDSNHPDAPPLYKAYPQAVIHSALPSPSIPADLILRAHERRGSSNAAEEMNQSTTDLGDGHADEKQKSKRKHRRNKSWSGMNMVWTTKIYVLAMSGHILEYSSEGPDDRLPEKSLRLSKDSAAFASDLIPGRHWVLQVASAMGSDGTTVPSAPDSKSIFSRFPFRATAEKRTALNMLLVFDSAEDMDTWLATTRRAIEAMGGKKGLTETGKPKVDPIVSLRDQPSRLTVTAPDQYRLSRSVPEDFAWDQEFSRRESDASFSVSDAAREQSMDEVSTTNSVISNDGQQLESLRGSANRLSFISSGQRTVITSAGSSPACSPTTETFPTQLEDPARRQRDSLVGESRLRPNAAAIMDRRKSLQTMQSMGPFVDVRLNTAGSRPQSTMGGGCSPVAEAEPAPWNKVPSTPNFSVPRSSNRRYSSAARMSALESKDETMAARATNRRPPVALRLTRPLSMVADQPSPKEGVPDRPATRHGDGRVVPLENESEPQAPSLLEFQPQIHEPINFSKVSPPRTTKLSGRSSPRRLSSMGALRGAAHGSHTAGAADWHAEIPPKARARLSAQFRPSDVERSHSSMGTHDRSIGSLSPVPNRVSKRVSMHSFIPDRPLPLRVQEQIVPYISEPLPQPAPPPSVPLPPVPTSSSTPQSKLDKSAQSLLSRRSMPQLVEGPPPAPPPSYALPPIPPPKAVGRTQA